MQSAQAGMAKRIDTYRPRTHSRSLCSQGNLHAQCMQHRPSLSWSQGSSAGRGCSCSVDGGEHLTPHTLYILSSSHIPINTHHTFLCSQKCKSLCMILAIASHTLVALSRFCGSQCISCSITALRAAPLLAMRYHAIAETRPLGCATDFVPPCALCSTSFSYSLAFGCGPTMARRGMRKRTDHR